MTIYESGFNFVCEVVTNAQRCALTGITVEAGGARYELREAHGRGSTVIVRDGRATIKVTNAVVRNADDAPPLDIAALARSSVVDVDVLVSGVPADDARGPVFSVVRIVGRDYGQRLFDCRYDGQTGALESFEDLRPRPTAARSATEPKARVAPGQVTANITVFGKTDAADVEWCDYVSFGPDDPDAEWSEIVAEPVEDGVSTGVHAGRAEIWLKHCRFTIWRDGAADAEPVDAAECAPLLEGAVITEIGAQLADSAGAPVEGAALADAEARITSAYGTVSVRAPHVPLLGD